MVKEHNLQLPAGCLYDTRYVDLPAEKIYDMLPDPKEVKSKMKAQGQGMGEGGGDWTSDKSRWGKERLISDIFLSFSFKLA